MTVALRSKPFTKITHFFQNSKLEAILPPALVRVYRFLESRIWRSATRGHTSSIRAFSKHYLAARLNQREIAKQLALSRQSVNMAIQGLQALDWIQIQRTPFDEHDSIYQQYVLGTVAPKTGQEVLFLDLRLAELQTFLEENDIRSISPKDSYATYLLTQQWLSAYLLKSPYKLSRTTSRFLRNIVPVGYGRENQENVAVFGVPKRVKTTKGWRTLLDEDCRLSQTSGCQPEWTKPWLHSLLIKYIKLKKQWEEWRAPNSEFVPEGKKTPQESSYTPPVLFIDPSGYQGLIDPNDSSIVVEHSEKLPLVASDPIRRISATPKLHKLVSTQDKRISGEDFPRTPPTPPVSNQYVTPKPTCEEAMNSVKPPKSKAPWKEIQTDVVEMPSAPVAPVRKTRAPREVPAEESRVGVLERLRGRTSVPTQARPSKAPTGQQNRAYSPREPRGSYPAREVTPAYVPSEAVITLDTQWQKGLKFIFGDIVVAGWTTGIQKKFEDLVAKVGVEAVTITMRWFFVNWSSGVQEKYQSKEPAPNVHFFCAGFQQLSVVAQVWWRKTQAEAKARQDRRTQAVAHPGDDPEMAFMRSYLPPAAFDIWFSTRKPASTSEVLTIDNADSNNDTQENEHA